MSKQLERAVLADRKRPCLYGVGPPCMHPRCLEAHYKTLKLQRTVSDIADKQLAQDETKGGE